MNINKILNHSKLEEARQMVQDINNACSSLGEVSYSLSDAVNKNRKFARSIFAVENISIGEVFSEKNIRSIRPGYGLHPKYLNKLIGQKSKKTYKRGDPLEKQ